MRISSAAALWLRARATGRCALAGGGGTDAGERSMAGRERLRLAGERAGVVITCVLTRVPVTELTA